MKLLNRLFRLTCWLLLMLLVQTTTAPALADPPPGGELPFNVIEPPVPVPPMAYQPPADANELSDFIPPNAVLLDVPIDLPGGPIPPTVEPTATLFPTIPPSGSATPEQPTAEPTSPPASTTPEQPPLGPVGFTSPTATLTITPTVSVTPEQPTVEPTSSEPPATFTPEITLTPTTEPPITPTQPVSVTVGLNGTLTNVVSFDQGQVAVVIEENTISPTAQLEFTTVPLPVSPVTTPITTTNTFTHPAGTTILMQFQLEVLENGTAVTGFDKPVRIVVDVRSLTADLNPVYADNFFLAYQDENDPTLWHDVPVTLHQETGLLSAEVMHFSGWATGVRPERWNPSWNPPAVSTFSGAATYSYPINISPGRNGLQPAVALSYSSRGIDGRIHDGEPGEVADGWSLTEISIVREEVKVESPFGSPLIHHPDKFRLVLNGTGHELYPESTPTFDSNPADDPPLRWYAKDAPGLKIMRYYDASTPTSGTDGLYWVVTTSHGTQYRLGYTPDSQEYQGGVLWYEQETHRGDNNLTSAIAWKVDTVTDSFGNQMTYHYYTRTTEEEIAWFNSDPLNPHWTTSTITTNSSRIATIQYNYNNSISTLPVTHTVARLSDTATPASRIEFRASSGDTSTTFTNPINSIYIYHGSSNPITEYRITSNKDTVNSPACLHPNSGVNDRHTQVVTAIQPFTNTDNNPATADTGYSLPATLFSYVSKPHYVDSSGACFSFRYLSQVQNGYGAAVSFTYTGDDRDVGTYWVENVWDEEHEIIIEKIYHYPEFGFNYVVTGMTSNDGRNHTTTTTYSYYKPCYGQYGSNVGENTGNPSHLTYQAFPCYTSVNDPVHSNIVGFERTTQTNYDFNGTPVLNKQITIFSQATSPNDTRGHPLRQEFYNASDVLLNCARTTYATQTNGSTTFTYTDEVNSYLFASGGDCSQNPPTGATVQTKVNTDYDSYGNPSVVYHYGDTSTPGDDRKITSTYYPNTSSGYWMVGQMAVQQEYDGISSPVLKRETRTYYDNTSNYTQPPTKGEVRQVTVGLGSSFITAAQNTYDVYGNVATTTTPSGATTTFTYDTTYQLYPVQLVVSASGLTSQTTSFEVYGFNGVALEGFQSQTGVLKKVTAPNGMVNVYEYDPFGRLYATYESLADRGNVSLKDDGYPVNRFAYWDNLWQGSISSPLAVTAYTWPNTRPGQASTYQESITYYDGFGRVFQERQRYTDVYGVGQRDIILTTEYNALGQARCTTTPMDIATTSGVVTTNCDTAGTTETTTTYDALARPLVTTAPDGSTTTTSYAIVTSPTVAGQPLQLTQVTDANHHRVNQYTNSQGQLVLVREIQGDGTGGDPYSDYADTRYHYDTWGNLLKVTTSTPSSSDPTSWLRRTTMSYDTWGRKTGMGDPDMGSWSYVYDAAGNLIRQTDAETSPGVLCFYYDALNRLTHKVKDSTPGSGCPTNPTTTGSDLLVSYTYDTASNGLGQLAQVSWGSNPAQNYDTFSYDSRGRLISQTRWLDGIPYVVNTLTFDQVNRPLTVQYPDGEVVTLTYDHEGENSLTAGNTALVSGIHYNLQGQMALLDRAGSVPDTNYSYFGATDQAGGGAGDSNFRLSGITSGSLVNFTYEYDKVGNITEITDNLLAGDKTQTFTYDHLNRLLSADTSADAITPYKHSYAYTLLGNINNRVEYQAICSAGCAWGNPTTYTYQYNDANHIHAVTDIGGYHFSYDANGNMTERSDNTGEYEQGFDVENRLVSVVKTGVGTTTFDYDASGQRVKTTQPDGTVIYTPFPTYEVEVKPDSWQPVSFPTNGYHTTDEPGWTMKSNDTPGYYFETPASLSWSSTRTFAGTTLLSGSTYQLDNLATGAVESGAIAVTAGETYQLSAWVKGEINGNAGTGPASVKVIHGGTVTTIWSTSSYSNTTWQQVQGDFVVPGGVSSVILQLSVSQVNGWVAFDDLSLTYKGNPITITNNSFESGSWTENPSTNYPATSIWRGNGGPASPAHQGSYSYLLSNLGHSQLESPLFAVTPGTRTIGIWVKGKYDGASSGGQVRLEALYYASGGGQIGAADVIWSDTSLSATSWQQMSKSSTAPAGTTQMRLRVVSEFNNLSVMVDDATVAGVTVPDGTFETGNVWTASHHAAFPAGVVAYEWVDVEPPDHFYTFSNSGYGEWRSAAVTVRPSQLYEVKTAIQGELNSTAGTGEAFLQVYFYDSGNNLLTGSPQIVWNSGPGYSGEVAAASSSFTTPANTATLKVGLLLKQANGWVAFDDVTLTSYSQAIHSGPGQAYDLSAWVRGVVSAPGGQLGGKVRVNFYDSGGSPVGEPATIWSSSSYNQTSGNGQLQSGNFTTPASTTSFRVGLEIHVDNGWLDMDDLTLTGWSHTINSGGSRNYDISAFVSGSVTAVAGQGGRLFIRYSPSGSDTPIWQNSTNYNSPSGTTQSGSFTTYSNTTSFKVGYEVRLDNGWLEFDVIQLTEYSGSVPASGDQTYELSALVSGLVSAPAVGDGGKLKVIFTPAGPGAITLWNSPTSYNSAGTPQTGQFTTPGGSTSFKMGYETRLDTGRLGFSTITLQQRIPSSTTQRSLYSLAGQAVAQQLKQESSSPQLVDTFSDNNSTGWTATAGTWSLTTTTPNGYAYQQTDTTSTATNSYRTLTQNSLTRYTWQMTFQSFGSTPRGAGFYFFGSDATNNSYHGYAYSVWQTESQIQLCENSINGSTCQVNNNLTATTGTTYRYQITYNPVTGQLLLWRDGVLAIAWTDSTPLTSGNHIAFRTQKSHVRFDDIRVTTYTSSFHYFFSDHLGSTSVLSNNSGSEVAGSRAYHLPFGSYRGTPPSQTLTDRSFTGQKENMELGLMYYNARYYAPGLGRFVSADALIPEPQNPQSFNRYSYTYNNPITYLDPTGHFTCLIDSDGLDAGISVSDCEDWVNQSLAILGLTETGSQIVEAFWAADTAAGEGGITIVIGGTVKFSGIIVAYPVSGPITIYERNINEMLNSNANFIFESIYLKPETILVDPFDPNNWDEVTDFAHEAIHAGQGFWNAWSVYGEAEAYYYEYQLVEEMNSLIASYNAARDPNAPIIQDINQHPLGTKIVSYGTLWNDATTIESFGKDPAFSRHPTNGWGWVNYKGGSISWQ